MGRGVERKEGRGERGEETKEEGGDKGGGRRGGGEERREEGTVVGIFCTHCQHPTWTKASMSISLSLTWRKALPYPWVLGHSCAHSNNTNSFI